MDLKTTYFLLTDNGNFYIVDHCWKYENFFLIDKKG